MDFAKKKRKQAVSLLWKIPAKAVKIHRCGKDIKIRCSIGRFKSDKFLVGGNFCGRVPAKQAVFHFTF